jgi:hypothetical protein
MPPTPDLHLSPSLPTPARTGAHVAELAYDNPQAFYEYIRQPRDPRHDYRSSKWARKFPSLSGIRHMSW